MEGGGSLTSASCKGSFQNASRLNPEEVLTHDVQSTLVTNAQGNKCEWICNPGYIKKDNTCQKVLGSCIGTFLNAHRVNEHEQLTTNIPSKLVPAETGKPCEWKCNEGYQYFGGYFPACKIRTYQCIGAEPAHAELILGDDKGLEEDTQRILVETASSRKCEYRCKAGYKLKNGKCKPVVKPVCKGKFPGGYDYNFIPSCLKVDQTLGTGKTAWANFSFGTIKCSKKQWETSGDCFDPKNITLFNTDTLNQSFCEVGSVDTQSLLNAYLSLNPNGNLSLKPDLDGFSHFNSFSNLGTATPSNRSLSASSVGRRNAPLGALGFDRFGKDLKDIGLNLSDLYFDESLCLWPHGMEDRYKFSALRNGPKPKLTYTCKNDGEEVTCPLRVRDPELTEIRGRVNPNKEVGFYVACKDRRLNNNGTCSICNTDAISRPFTGNEELYCSNLGRASNYSYQENSPIEIVESKYNKQDKSYHVTKRTIKIDHWRWTCKTHIGDLQQCLALKGDEGISNCVVGGRYGPNGQIFGVTTCLGVSRFDQHDNGGDGGFPGDPGSFDNGFGGNNNSKWRY